MMLFNEMLFYSETKNCIITKILIYMYGKLLLLLSRRKVIDTCFAVIIIVSNLLTIIDNIRAKKNIGKVYS
jgi:hypothetical protein